MMNRGKKKIALILCSLMSLCVCLIFVGCEEQEEQKYDVTFMLVCREASSYAGNPTGPILESWIISPEQNTLQINREYDEKKYIYYVSQYTMPDHPELGDVWFNYPITRSYLQTSVFEQSRFIREEEKYDTAFMVIWEKGKYINEIKVRDLPALKPRSVILHITIT